MALLPTSMMIYLILQVKVLSFSGPPRLGIPGGDLEETVFAYIFPQGMPGFQKEMSNPYFSPTYYCGDEYIHPGSVATEVGDKCVSEEYRKSTWIF